MPWRVSATFRPSERVSGTAHTRSADQDEASEGAGIDVAELAKEANTVDVGGWGWAGVTNTKDSREGCGERSNGAAYFGHALAARTRANHVCRAFAGNCKKEVNV
jgi:hypothetical protein